MSAAARRAARCRHEPSLQIRTTVHDYDGWKAAFDKYERFREEHGVRSYRVLRRADDAHDVQVILDFDDRGRGGRVPRPARADPGARRSRRRQLVSHEGPVLLEVVGRQSW